MKGKKFTQQKWSNLNQTAEHWLMLEQPKGASDRGTEPWELAEPRCPQRRWQTSACLDQRSWDEPFCMRPGARRDRYLVNEKGTQNINQSCFNQLEIWKMKELLAIRICWVNAQDQITFLAEVHIRKEDFGWGSYWGHFGRGAQSWDLIRSSSRWYDFRTVKGWAPEQLGKEFLEMGMN